MKISIEAKVLAKGMKSAAAILSGTAIIPIAGNVRLVASDKTLEITTCDLELEYRQSLPMAVKGEISTTVDAKRLLAVATTAPADATLNLSLGDGRLTVTAGRGRWVLPTLPVDDFPTLPIDTLGTAMPVGGAELSKALRRVEWAIYNGRAQLHLQGAYIHAEEGKARLVATNGNAMAVADLDAAFPADSPDAMVPTKFAGSLADIADGHDGEVILAWDGRKLRAEIGDCVLTGKLMDANFPDYRRVIPPADAAPVVADPEAMASALRRVMVISDEKTRCVKIDRATDRITLAASNGGTEQSDEEVMAECASDFTSGINGQFLSQVLASIGGDSIELHQADDRSPFMFRRVVNDGAFAIVMPMKI